MLLVPPGLGIPQAAEIRVFPMSDARARHWHRWFAVNVFWLVFVIVTFALMGTFGFDTKGRFALSVPTSFVQLALILLAVWLRPGNAPAGDGQQGNVSTAGWSWLLSFYFTVVWILQIAGAWTLYWFVIAALRCPPRS